jgi:hypothetical protein
VEMACVYEKPNAKVNRRQCGALTSVLNDQLAIAPVLQLPFALWITSKK